MLRKICTFIALVTIYSLTNANDQIEARLEFFPAANAKGSVIVSPAGGCEKNETLISAILNANFNAVRIDHCTGRIRSNWRVTRITALGSVPDGDLLSDYANTIRWLKKEGHGDSTIILLGQAQSGGIINRMAYAKSLESRGKKEQIDIDAFKPVAGFIVYYPFCALGRVPPVASKPYLGFFAGKDDFDNPYYGCQVTKPTAVGAKEYVVYLDAKHGFDNEYYVDNKKLIGRTKAKNNFTIEYSKANAEASTIKLKAFLNSF